MPTVSQHYGHHAAPRTDKSALATRRAAAPVVLMVSGGADSTALLLMACTSKLDIQGRARRRSHCARAIARAACKPSSAREASDGDEAFVRDLCAQYGLPLCVEHAYLMTNRAISRLRLARCAMPAARDMFANFVLNRVHRGRRLVSVPRILLSDRAETFLMNAIKGSGPAG